MRKRIAELSKAWTNFDGKVKRRERARQDSNLRPLAPEARGARQPVPGDPLSSGEARSARLSTTAGVSDYLSLGLALSMCPANQTQSILR
jgi:hypothetical protein